MGRIEVYVRGCLYFLTAFVMGRMIGEIDNTKTERNTRPEETVNTELVKSETAWQDHVPQDSERPVEVKDEKTLETDINIYDSFAQIETNMMHKTIEFPGIEIVGAEEIANLINEQIYSEIIPTDFEQYHVGREDIEIRYEIENISNEIISIHFQGYLSYCGSYTACDKGLNFNLQTGSIISLEDYYTLPDIRRIIDDAGKENEIRIYEEIPETKQEIDNFIQLFDSEEYIARTDIFFLKENHIYFIVPWDESGRHYIHVELSLDGFSKLQ